MCAPSFPHTHYTINKATCEIQTVVVVVSHIQHIGCQPEKTTLHGGHSRSWSMEQGKENKRKGLAAYPRLPHCSFGEKKKKKITRRIYRRYAGLGRSHVRTRISSARRLGQRVWLRKILHSVSGAEISRFVHEGNDSPAEYFRAVGRLDQIQYSFGLHPVAR